MKAYIFGIAALFTAFLFITGCGANAENDEPKTPALKKTMLQKKLEGKRSDLDKLQFEIKEIEKELLALDPNYKEEELEKKARLVSTAAVKVKKFEQFAEFQGTVETKETYTASSEIGGILRSLTVKEGDYVTKGQLIGRVDDQVMQSNQQELEVQLKLAKDVLSRRQKLWEQGIGAEIELIQARNNVEALNKSIATLQTQMAKTAVYAPQNGVVDQVMIKQGEMAGPGMPILMLINTASVQVAADVPENYLSNVKRGMQVKVKIPALDIEQTGRIRKISPTINPANRTFSVEIGISSKGGKVKPNLIAMVEIRESVQDNTVVVPTNLIQQVGEENYIYIVGEEEGRKIAEKRAIEIGDSFQGETAVLAGLEGKETLITDGSRDVSNGDMIKLVN